MKPTNPLITRLLEIDLDTPLSVINALMLEISKTPIVVTDEEREMPSWTMDDYDKAQAEFGQACFLAEKEPSDANKIAVYDAYFKLGRLELVTSIIRDIMVDLEPNEFFEDFMVGFSDS